MIETDRIVLSNTKYTEELELDRTVRPKFLKEYIGQAKVREQMQLFVDAAQARSEPLDHTLIFGPPGLGKTTLANIIANEMQSTIKSTAAPAIEKSGDLAAMLTNLDAGDVLFIDEIHRLKPQVEEILYSAMEDFKLDIIIGDGAAARSIKLDLPPFTLVGATTRAGMLTGPLRDRFGIVQRLEFYNIEELTFIIERNANLSNVGIEHAGAIEIAKRSRGTPRIANRLLRRVRDFAQIRADSIVTEYVASEALNLLDVDNYGLDYQDHKFLKIIIDNFSGGPVGLDSLSASLGEDKSTLEDVLEPYLIQHGFLIRTPKGRKVTNKAYQHFGYELQDSVDIHIQTSLV